MATDPYPRWLHRSAIATALAVFPLIVVGSGVTSQDAGMAFPDWPTSDGHLVNPPNWWDGTDTRWEHGHRLIGWCVGMLATASVVMAWRQGGATRALALGTFVAIGIQGVLGGLRVTEVSTPLALVHGIWGQLCFCLAALLAAITSHTWRGRSESAPALVGKLVFRLSLAATVAVFLQLVLGAMVRHFGGNHALIAHVGWALVVALFVAWFAVSIVGLPDAPAMMARLAYVLLALLVMQIVLGALAYSMTEVDAFASFAWSWVGPSAHVAVGALIFANTVVLALAVRKFVRLEPEGTVNSSPVGLAAS